MKPTDEQVLQWAREAGFEITVTALIRPYIESVAAIAYAAGAAAMKERCVDAVERDDSMRWSGAADAIHALGDDDDDN